VNFTQEQELKILVGTAKGLLFLHKQEVIHRETGLFSNIRIEMDAVEDEFDVFWRSECQSGRNVPL